MSNMPPDVCTASHDEMKPPSANGLQRLWLETLNKLLRDAQLHCETNHAEPAYELEQAFDDVMRCGPMTRYVCSWLEIRPETVTETFIRYLEAKE